MRRMKGGGSVGTRRRWKRWRQLDRKRWAKKAAGVMHQQGLLSRASLTWSSAALLSRAAGEGGAWFLGFRRREPLPPLLAEGGGPSCPAGG